jgi:hypothetical protein
MRMRMHGQLSMDRRSRLPRLIKNDGSCPPISPDPAKVLFTRSPKSRFFRASFEKWKSTISVNPVMLLNNI